MIEKMWEILTTITEESQQASLSKCVELGLDQNRGLVSLEESFINLNSARFTLIDAIEKNKLVQLPITIQNKMFAMLESISKHQTSLIAGTDEVVNLANAIELLNVAIWQYGLHNLSDEVLGYEAKLNQLKTLELEAKDLRRKLHAGLKLNDRLELLVTKTSTQNEEIAAIVSTVNTAGAKVDSELIRITEAGQKATASLTVIQQSEATVTQQLAAANLSVADISAHETKITEFFERISEYRKKINTVEEDANKAVAGNKEKTDELITTLATLEGQIKEQLQKATGVSLFHSFGTRQGLLNSSTKWWLKALTVLVVVSVGLPVYVLNTTTGMDTAFFLKLSMSLPLIYAFTFCTLQYSRERKLEEEYAFKSNISISLMPYQELVEKLVAGGQPEEKQKYTTFIIDSINKVFTSPTEKIFDHENKQKSSSGDTIKQVSSLIETIGKTFK
ncbi:MAG: hypothetical protein A2076_06565 [Geobacteraceae bacterium GWC2_53_11]|nr:MAG: hypothetical protein A2076_06565 [Geobacteraceae bacterium GWC2_53_11]